MTTEPATISVNLPGGGYSIRIGDGGMDRWGADLATLSGSRRATVITDSIVGPLYADRASASLASAEIEAWVETVPAGDGSKSLAQAGRLYDALAAHQHQRTDLIIALGGGMIGDLAGFVAATWMRGVPLVLCPTSMEADIDASVGGKNAINLSTAKNLVGAFHRPIAVFVDVSCLQTLPPRDFTAGLAESVKHAVLSGEALLEWHERHVDLIRKADSMTCMELIQRNCAFKAGVVVDDERETAVNRVGRAALNLGHTIGHALEAEFNYELRHGECVALGLVAEWELAVRCARFDSGTRDRCVGLLKRLGLPTAVPRPVSPVNLIRRMKLDKKNAASRIRFVTVRSLGEPCWITDPPERDMVDSIAAIQPD